MDEVKRTVLPAAGRDEMLRRAGINPRRNMFHGRIKATVKKPKGMPRRRRPNRA